MEVTTRGFRPSDAVDLAEVMFRSVRELGGLDYDDAQIRAWMPERPRSTDFLRRGADGRRIFVATNAHERPIGYVDLEPDGHIDHFFCLPEAAGRGVGSRLLAAVVDEAEALGLPRLYVEASEAARRLLERRGFVIIARRDFELRGVPVHNYAMERELPLP